MIVVVSNNNVLLAKLSKLWDHIRSFFYSQSILTYFHNSTWSIMPCYIAGRRNLFLKHWKTCFELIESQMKTIKHLYKQVIWMTTPAWPRLQLHYTCSQSSQPYKIHHENYRRGNSYGFLNSDSLFCDLPYLRFIVCGHILNNVIPPYHWEKTALWLFKLCSILVETWRSSP